METKIVTWLCVRRTSSKKTGSDGKTRGESINAHSESRVLTISMKLTWILMDPRGANVDVNCEIENRAEVKLMAVSGRHVNENSNAVRSLFALMCTLIRRWEPSPSPHRRRGLLSDGWSGTRQFCINLLSARRCADNSFHAITHSATLQSLLRDAAMILSHRALCVREPAFVEEALSRP